MLSLRVYLGEVRQGELVVTGAHEPLIDRETFDTVQRLPKARKRRGAANFLLRGKIRCAGCGYPMAGWAQPRHRADGTVDRVRVYRCVRKTAHGKCESRATVMAEPLEALVLEALEPHASQLAATIESGADHPELAELTKQLVTVEQRLERLATDFGSALDPDVWQSMVAAQNRQRRELLEQRDAAMLAAGIGSAQMDWRQMDDSERWELMLAGLDAVLVRKSERRGQPIADRIKLLPLGSAAHLFPSERNGYALAPLWDAVGD